MPGHPGPTSEGPGLPTHPEREKEQRCPLRQRGAAMSPLVDEDRDGNLDRGFQWLFDEVINGVLKHRSS
jgi:hypothetical protein